MDRVVWLIAGNKGGVGKSVVAKALAEWLQHADLPVTVVDGDARTPDVAAAFDGLLPTVRFDLHDANGWPAFSDYLCTADEDGVVVSGHVVTNLPDGISERAMLFFERFMHLVQAYGFAVKVLFVMNRLPDGLHLFGRLQQSFPDVIPVKNLAFGKVREFEHFDLAYGADVDERVVLLPAMNARIMGVVRESSLPFSAFLDQTTDVASNFIYAKLVVSDWRDSAFEAFDDVLYFT
ncbi:P-loop NTPase [Paracidovorax citrulli]